MTQVIENKKRRLSRREHKVLKKQRQQKKKESGTIEEELQPKEVELISEKVCVTDTALTGTNATIATQSLEQNQTSFGEDTISYLKDYVPIPVPPLLEDDCCMVDEGISTTAINAKSIRGWFPSAHVVKCDGVAAAASDDVELKNCSIVLFYQYVAVTNEHHKPWTQRRVQQLQRYLIQVAETRKTIGGRIRISVEGVNATISSLGPQGVRYIQQDLINFDSTAFQHTDFKFIDNLPPDRHFTSLKILPVKELVYYGFHQQEKPYEADMENGSDNTKINPNVTEDMVAPLHRGGIHLDPRDYHEKLKMDNTVVIDVRNHYEAAIGRFDGQQQQQGAEYIDPKMRKSTDFAQWIQQPQVQNKLKGKQVLMFCTVRALPVSIDLNETNHLILPRAHNQIDFI
jgi:predicted sulfurtransferase